MIQNQKSTDFHQWISDFGASDGTHLAFGNLPCLTTVALQQYPFAHLLIKKQSTGLFFFTFAALLGFKSRHRINKKFPNQTFWSALGIWCE